MAGDKRGGRVVGTLGHGGRGKCGKGRLVLGRPDGRRQIRLVNIGRGGDSDLVGMAIEEGVVSLEEEAAQDVEEQFSEGSSDEDC